MHFCNPHDKQAKSVIVNEYWLLWRSRCGIGLGGDFAHNVDGLGVSRCQALSWYPGYTGTGGQLSRESLDLSTT
jgi:hypothetical protein